MMPWVLIDTSYLAYRALYSMGELTHDGEHTEVLFNLLEQIRSICMDSKVMSNRVALVFDSRQSYRKKEYEDYKRKRVENRSPEEVQSISVMYQQVKVLKKVVLPMLGIPSYRQIGLESDDLLAEAARHLSETGEGLKGIIISSDGDLFQCITPQVHWYDPTRRLYYDPDSFQSIKGVRPKVWGDVKAIGGCAGDGVPGIEGVGVKTAVQYLLGILPKTYKRYRAIDSPEGRAVRKRNEGLVILPHVKAKPFILQEPKYSMSGFRKMCKQFGFSSYLKGSRKKNWNEFFSLGQSLGSPRRRKVEHGKGKKKVKGQRKGLIV